jgi:hypothetical protein
MGALGRRGGGLERIKAIAFQSGRVDFDLAEMAPDGSPAQPLLANEAMGRLRVLVAPLRPCIPR